MVQKEEVPGYVYTSSQHSRGQSGLDRHHWEDPVETGTQKQRCVYCYDVISDKKLLIVKIVKLCFVSVVCNEQEVHRLHDLFHTDSAIYPMLTDVQ